MGTDPGPGQFASSVLRYPQKPPGLLNLSPGGCLKRSFRQKKKILNNLYFLQIGLQVMAVSNLMLAIEGTWKQQGLVWEYLRGGAALGHYSLLVYLIEVW